MVTWHSKKENVIARSTAKVEFRGMAHGSCELLWLQILVAKIDFESKGPIQLDCDNQAAREIANNPVQHDPMNHVEVDRHFTKEKLDIEFVDTSHVRFEEQLTDLLMHAVSACFS